MKMLLIGYYLIFQKICKNIIDYRGKTPAKLGADWAKSGYRVFSAKNIKTGNIVQTDIRTFIGFYKEVDIGGVL